MGSDVDSGRLVDSDPCTGCHGPNGRGGCALVLASLRGLNVLQPQSSLSHRFVTGHIQEDFTAVPLDSSPPSLGIRITAGRAFQEDVLTGDSCHVAGNLVEHGRLCKVIHNGKLSHEAITWTVMLKTWKGNHIHIRPPCSSYAPTLFMSPSNNACVRKAITSGSKLTISECISKSPLLFAECP